METTPREPPATLNEAQAAPCMAPRATIGRYAWLATVSALLAFLLEGCAVEGDLLFVLASPPPSLFWLFLAKLTFLGVILLPMGIYIRCNGWLGLQRVKGRAILIGCIVGLNLLAFVGLVLEALSNLTRTR